MTKFHVTRVSMLALVFIVACMEEHARERFETVVNQVCVTTPLEQTIDQRLHTQAQGCVLLSPDPSVIAGLDETRMVSGVYRTQGTNLGFSHYRDEVIIVRAGETLGVMTPAALQVLAEAAGAVHEAQLEEEHLRAGLGLVLLGSLQAFTAAEPQQLTPEQIMLVQKSF
ncbi:MAG: hypothetical protein AB7G75_30320 [Candidatus Binatia bacterium]